MGGFRLKPRGPIAALEESLALLKRAPHRFIAGYFLGTLPFLAGLLFFWSEMSMSAFAYGRAAPDALAMAVLFVWMKMWQSWFASNLAGFIRDEPLIWTRGAFLRSAMIQGTIQPWSLILLPIAAVITLPFAWTYGFFQNLLVFGDGRLSMSEACARSSRNASLWQVQALAVFGILSALSLFVFLNILLTAFLLPYLAKILLGIESVFTRSGPYILNTTCMAGAAALTYAFLDPLAKAYYVLRTFDSDARASGLDLLVALRRLAVLIFVIFISVTAGHAMTRNVTPDKLDESIRKTMTKPEFGWRLPRAPEPPASAKKGMIGRFLDAVIGWMEEIAKAFGKMFAKMMRQLWKWMEPWFKRKFEDQPERDWSGIEITLLSVLGSAVIAAFSIWLYRAWKRSRRAISIVTAEPLKAEIPDLEAEDTTPDAMPEDGWLDVADRLRAEGELRLSLRALYMASLVALARHHRLTLARFKTNREYRLELVRRTGDRAALLAAFEGNLRSFESSWYGRRVIDENQWEQFRFNVMTIREQAA